MTQQDNDDQKGVEGNTSTGDDKPSKYGVYRCQFRAADDALHIAMKDTKSKRAFGNEFSKSTLIDMDLKQSSDKVIKLLEESISGKNHELKFAIGFGDANNNKKVSMNNLSKVYNNGDALYISVSMDFSFFNAEYIFKLLEKKRNETDILRDIIADMQEEIDQLKEKVKPPRNTGIASWFSTAANGASGYIPLGGVLLAQTLDGMVTLSNDTTTITINMPGIYQVTGEINWTSSTGAGHIFRIYSSGSIVAEKYGSNSGGFGQLTRVLNLKKGDTLRFYMNHGYGTSKLHSCFTIQKIE